MKLVQEFFIIAFVSFLGEVLSRLIPFPIPASVWGLLLMFAALKTKIIKVQKVKTAGNFLLDVMPLMFVPPAISLLANLEVLKAHWWQLLLICLVSTVLVMAISGIVTQFLMKILSKRK